MKTKFLFALLFFACRFVLSQDKISDSLVLRLDQVVGAEKLDVLLHLSRHTNTIGDYQRAIDFAKDARAIAEKHQDSLNLTAALRLEGVGLRKLERLDESIDVLDEAYGVAKRNNFKSELKFITNSLAIIYTNRAQYDKALEYNFQSLVLREAEGDLFEVSVAYNNIGFVYYHLRNYSRALDYYYKALAARKKINDQYDLDKLLINIGICELHLGRYDLAIKGINEAFGICGDQCDDDVRIEGWNALGIAYSKIGEESKAKEYLQSSLKLSVNNKNHRFEVENSVLLGTIAVEEKEFTDAEKFLKKAEAIASSSGYNQLLLRTYEQLFKLYEAKSDLAIQNLYQKKYIYLKDSLISEDLVNNIAKIQVGFEERENLKTIKEKDQILQLKEEIIDRQRAQYAFILTIAVLAVLLVFVLIRYNRRQSEANQALAAAKAAIEDKNRQLEMVNAVLDKRVQERTIELKQANSELQKVNDELDNFIYKTSHDIRGPLASLKGMTNVAIMDVKDSVALDYFKKLDASAEKLNTILTRLVIVNHINHVTLSAQKIDFVHLIDEILVLERKKGVPARLHISYHVDPNVVLNSDKGVLRIAMENLIDNAIKFYSDSERVNPFVKIEVGYRDNGNVEIKVIDNGIGIRESDREKLFQMFMRASERSETGGIGLYLAKLATEKLGGKIHFTETVDRYTQFSIELPVYFTANAARHAVDDQQRQVLATDWSIPLP